MTARTPYLAPGWFDRQVLNRFVALLSRRGISIMGSRVLEVPGRRTGTPQRVPVNLLRLAGSDYLVAPRGQTQWVRNLRAAGGGALLLGRSRTQFSAVEVADADKEPLLRAYLERWQFEVGRFFDGVTHDSAQAELQRIAPNHPVFKLDLGPASRA
jgi:deazaflavin-dependent oxidoreductase (nitroreductase family)